MKKYHTPTLHIVTVELEGQLLTDSDHTVYTVNSNADIRYDGKGSAEAARVKGNSVDWDDWSE